MGITICSLDLKDSIADLENGNIEGSTTEIEDSYLLILLLIEPVSKRSSRWLIDYAPDIESCNSASILGCLSLK